MTAQGGPNWSLGREAMDPLLFFASTTRASAVQRFVGFT
jgi:hypothetical protein